MTFFGKKCPKCGANNDKTASFCDSCGFDLVAVREARVEGNSWQARPDEFAASLTVADLEGMFSKRLEVRPGCRALIFQDGRLQGSVTAGEYTLDGFLSRINRLGRNKNLRAIVTREDELPVTFSFKDIPTREYLDLELELTLGVRLDQPEAFAGRLMGDRQTFRIEEMRSLMASQVRQALVEYIGNKGIRELKADPGLRTELGGRVERGLAQLASDNGLALGQVSALVVGHTQFDANNRERGKAWLLVDGERAALEQRTDLDELYGAEEWRKIARLELDQQLQVKTRELTLRDQTDEHSARLRRIELLEKIRVADQREALIEQGARDEAAKLELEAKQSLLQRQDQQATWEQVRKLAEIKRDTELSLARMEQERAVTLARAELEAERERHQFDQEIALATRVDSEEGRRLAVSLERQRTEADFRRAQQVQELRHQMDSEAIGRQMAEQQKEFERVQAYRDWEFRKEQVVWEDKRKAEEEDLKIKKMRELVDLDLLYDQREDERTRATQEEERRTKEQEARLERERMAAMGTLGAEALATLATSDERARVIADMQRTKGMQNMSEEQILAMGAERSSAVAEALQARFRQDNAGAQGERERQLQDRLLAQQESQMERLERLHREAQMGQVATMNKVLDTMASIQRERPAAPQPVFVTPVGGASPQPVAASDWSGAGRSERVLLCPSCRWENPLAARFCGNCGKPVS